MSTFFLKTNPENGALLDSGWIIDPSNEMFYSFASLAVNRSGAMLIGFSTFSPNTYPSAGYIYRDANGGVSEVKNIKSGNTPYLLAPDGGIQRWGDYTATVVDPMSNTTFWTYQIVALDQHWVTWWAKIETGTPKRQSVRH